MATSGMFTTGSTKVDW